MKDELSYIDNITGDKLKGYTVTPETSWELMNSKLTNVVAESTIGSFFSNIGGFFTTKFFVVSVVILSIITVGILISNNDSGNDVLQKGSSLNKEKSYHETVFNKDENAKKSSYVAGDSLTNVNEPEKIDNNSKDVIIKVEVPVHKNVIIKKEIIIKDTIN